MEKMAGARVLLGEDGRGSNVESRSACAVTRDGGRGGRAGARPPPTT